MTREVFGQTRQVHGLGAMHGYPRLFLFGLQAPHQILGLPHRQSPGDHRPPRRQLLGPVLRAEQRPGVTHAEAALDDARLDLLRQLPQAQEIGHRGAAFADPRGRLVLGEVKLLDQAVIGLGLLDRVEVLALDVFHERQFEQLVVADGLDHDRDLGEPGPAGGPQAALSGDELEAGVGFADDQRLQDPLLADRAGELRELLLGKLTAGLEPVRANQVDVAEEKAVLGLRRSVRRPV